MIPPRGFKAEQYPLRHRLAFSAALSLETATKNTVFLPIVMGSTDMDTEPTAVIVNPHNPAYVEDAGPLCRQMSIIDRMRISLKFNMTEDCNDLQETAAGTFTGDSIHAFHFMWRPIFGSFKEKLDAKDDDTGISVATILALTHTEAEEDVVPLTTTKLTSAGSADKVLPSSTVNAVQVFGDMNMTSDFTMEEHVWDEDQFHKALRRFTNKGALRSMVGRTRNVTLTRNQPYKNFYLDKFVPRVIRRIVPYSFMGIQVHLPVIADIGQVYQLTAPVSSGHLGIKCIANYHEWNPEHEQGMGTQV